MPTLKSRIGAKVLRVAPINRRTFNILRHEFRTLQTTVGNALNPQYHALVARLRKSKDLSINFGSGGRGLSDWVNVEMIKVGDTTICLDIRRPLPFADGSARRIFIEHVVEHLDFALDIPRLFSEFHRILAPGGTARIIVPDARRFAEAYVSGDRALWKGLGWDLDAFPDDIFTPMHIVNHTFHQGGEHLFGYDFETLAFALGRAGFADIRKLSFKISTDEALNIDQPIHEKSSLYIEAIK